MRYLYRRTHEEFTIIGADKVQRDIFNNWRPDYNAFSIGQMCDRNNVSKRSCRASVKRLIAAGLVEQIPEAADNLHVVKFDNSSKLSPKDS